MISPPLRQRGLSGPPQRPGFLRDHVREFLREEQLCAFDASYAAELSADAVPPLLAAMHLMPAPLQCGFAESAIVPLAARSLRDDRWTLGRVNAERALAADAVLPRCGLSL